MKPRGGRREGAGRKKGGRDKLSIDLSKSVIESGMLPVEFMLKLMRGEFPGSTLAMQATAARDVAPYIHKKMPQEGDVKFSGTLLCKWQD